MNHCIQCVKKEGVAQLQHPQSIDLCILLILLPFVVIVAQLQHFRGVSPLDMLPTDGGPQNLSVYLQICEPHL